MKRFLIALLGGAVVLAAVLLLVAQLVPYGRDHTNPPVLSEPEWDSADTQALAERACYDCHSNETTWPWYASVAPVSWLVQHDVEEGRQYLNFSRWAQGGGEESEEMGEVILEGSMPPAVYLITHPEARLTAAEKDVLARGLMHTAGQSPTASREYDEHNEGGEHEGDD